MVFGYFYGDSGIELRMLGLQANIFTCWVVLFALQWVIMTQWPRVGNHRVSWCCHPLIVAIICGSCLQSGHCVCLTILFAPFLLRLLIEILLKRKNWPFSCVSFILGLGSHGHYLWLTLPISPLPFVVLNQGPPMCRVSTLPRSWVYPCPTNGRFKSFPVTFSSPSPSNIFNVTG